MTEDPRHGWGDSGSQEVTVDVNVTRVVDPCYTRVPSNPTEDTRSVGGVLYAPGPKTRGGPPLPVLTASTPPSSRSGPVLQSLGPLTG